MIVDEFSLIMKVLMIFFCRESDLNYNLFYAHIVEISIKCMLLNKPTANNFILVFFVSVTWNVLKYYEYVI